MKRLFNRFGRAAREESGITGLETAIILIAFVVVASVFAFVVLSTGIFSSERGKEAVFAGLQKTRGALEVNSSVIATAAGTPLAVDFIIFDVSLAAGGSSVNLDTAATTNRTVIAYNDAALQENDVTYTATEITGNGDALLEPGELFTLTITPPAAATIDPNDIWSLEVKPPTGSYMIIQRMMPPALAAVMNLN